MWKYLQNRLGITELNERMIAMTTTIADAKAAIDAIRDDVAPLGARIDSVNAKLLQLQQSAGSPSTATTLSVADQTLLDSIVQEAGDIKGSVDNLSAKLPPDAPTA